MVGKVEILATTCTSSTLKFNLPSCGTSDTDGSSSARVLSLAVNEDVRTEGIVPLLKISPFFLKFTPKPESSP